MELAPRSEVQPHSHPHEQMGLLLEGELTFTIGGQTQTLQAGRRCGGFPAASFTAASRATSPAKAIDVFHPVPRTTAKWTL